MAEEDSEKKKECEFLRSLALKSAARNDSDNDSSSPETEVKYGKKRSFTLNTAYFFICLMLGSGLLIAVSKIMWAITSWLPKILQNIAVIGLSFLSLVFLLPFFIKFGNFAERFLKREQEDNEEEEKE